MALTESYRKNSLIPSYLYSSQTSFPSTAAFNGAAAAATSPATPSTARRSFVVAAPSEPGKIEMYSPAFYAACTVGGILSCGLTHTAVTPLDLVKCNMQVLSITDLSLLTSF